ncbi:type IV pilus modification PilV family protein [Petrocella sp. FN5]|uniref:type IV pilus modification PilV family protein n=1 Tax=Petrocella sp. FN5 TaxID=3032002 RepID=UPI0023DADE71|nr:prepilin-type N-terminal cleavage/methylation domain-containing protein [Petrocella sp. FN5]MDF1617027.1 prepilin-type N-terminal cleavage/methylation domain-containing protein [Petrocella sp. FN5]
MIKSWWNKLKSNSGFSLVEALVTIAIVGAAMIPISMVFTQTIGTTVETRKQLVANGLGQEYLEAIKAKEFSDFASVFGVNTNIEINDSFTQDTYDLMGLTPLPKGYRAVLSYDTSVDINAFALPTPNPMPDADIIIDIPSGYMNTVILTDTSSGNQMTYPQTPTSSTDRVIRIRGDRDTNTITLDYFDQLTSGGGSIDSRFSITVPSTDPVIRLLMGEGRVGTPMITRIDIKSNLPQTIKLYFYEEDTNSVKATTNIISGSVSISRNLNAVDTYDRRILGIKVEIFDTYSGKKLGTYTTTKISE